MFEEIFSRCQRMKVGEHGVCRILRRLNVFSDHDSLNDKGFMDPKHWGVLYWSSTPTLQALVLKLLGQPCSLSCCERNWSIYYFIFSLARKKMAPERAQDLVYVHTNFPSTFSKYFTIR